MMQKNTKNILWVGLAVLALLILSLSVYTVGNDYFNKSPVEPAGNGSVQPPGGSTPSSPSGSPSNSSPNSSGEGFEPGNSGPGTIIAGPGGSGTVAAMISVSGSYAPADWSSEKTVTVVTKTTKIPIQYTRWAMGEFTNETFPTDSSLYSDYTVPFNVSDDGKITFYVEDERGSKNTSVLTIENIDNTTPVIDSVSLNPAADIRGQSVEISMTVTDSQSGVASVKYAKGEFTTGDFPSDGTETEIIIDADGNGNFSVTENENYTICAVDNAGNAVVFVQNIAHVDTTAPVFGSAVLDPATNWNPMVNISVTVSDSESGVSIVQYAKGRFTADNFTADSTPNTITLDGNNANFTVSANGRYTIYAEDGAGNKAVTVVQVSNVDKKKPVFESVALNPASDWNQTIDISVSVTDDQSDVSAIMYAKGKFSVSDFPVSTATDITTTSEFTVFANGRYTIYAEDGAGNKAVKVVQVLKIDVKPPKFDSVSLDPATGTWNQTVNVSVSVSDTQSGVALVKYEKGRYDVLTFPNGATDITADKEFMASENGKYTIYMEDSVGNKAVKIVSVTNVDTTAPAVSGIFEDIESTPNKVLFKAMDSQSGILAVKYLAGNHVVDDFAGTGGTVLTESDGNYSFDVESGTNIYTVYTIDNIGNERIKRINILNIDTEPPVISDVSVSNASVWEIEKTVTFNATDDDEIAVVQYVKGDFDKNTFDFPNATTLIADSGDEYSFDVTENGNYTIYAQDATGNKAVHVVEVAKIDAVNPTIGFSNTTVPGYSETLTLTISDSESGINSSASLWVKGTCTQEDFEDAGSDAETLTSTTLTFYRNGVYSFYVKDNAGRVTVETYQVQ
ncbi:hypothetical protein [Methanolapillus millepedarum]|uniref:Uncharacterized protein n=1 Tax=Methanolapillus millepedarum TaxID=3028296 RepID=A0AA97A3J7_9EURY|nr:hypothetical protein MsAc7_06120 [Methanosarcinaceae archaeon Ac7]